MLEATRPYGAPARPFLSSMISYGVACEPWELAGYWALRREIFCAETALFGSHAQEQDAHDAAAAPLVAIAHSAGTPERVIGVVRVFSVGDGVWYGGRLGVERDYRTRPSIGGGLIRCAVLHAAAHGCMQFYATVLRENARYFERFHFHAERAVMHCERPHVLMRADLHAYCPNTHASERSAA